MTVAECFAANLLRIRKEADLSQEQLSTMASIHRTEVSMLERGIRVPRIDTLVKLACSLEVSAGALLAGIDWKPGAPVLGRFRVSDKGASL